MNLCLSLSIYLSYPLFFSLDKVDDELEMTMVCHRPEGLDQLEAQTNFTKQELQVLYRGFKNVRCATHSLFGLTFYSHFALISTLLIDYYNDLAVCLNANKTVLVVYQM